MLSQPPECHQSTTQSKWRPRLQSMYMANFYSIFFFFGGGGGGPLWTKPLCSHLSLFEGFTATRRSNCDWPPDTLPTFLKPAARIWCQKWLMVTNTKRSVAVSALFIEVDDQTFKHVVLKRQRFSNERNVQKTIVNAEKKKYSEQIKELRLKKTKYAGQRFPASVTMSKFLNAQAQIAQGFQRTRFCRCQKMAPKQHWSLYGGEWVNCRKKPRRRSTQNRSTLENVKLRRLCWVQLFSHTHSNGKLVNEHFSVLPVSLRHRHRWQHNRWESPNRNTNWKPEISSSVTCSTLHWFHGHLYLFKYVDNVSLTAISSTLRPGHVISGRAQRVHWVIFSWCMLGVGSDSSRSRPILGNNKRRKSFSNLQLVCFWMMKINKHSEVHVTRTEERRVRH